MWFSWVGGSPTASKPSSRPPVHITVQLASLPLLMRPSLCCYCYCIGFMLACRGGLAPGSHRVFGEAVAGCLLEGSPTSVSTSSVSTISSSAPHPRVGASKRELQLRDSAWGALHSGQWTLRQACSPSVFGCLEIQIWEQRKRASFTSPQAPTCPTIKALGWQERYSGWGLGLVGRSTGVLLRMGCHPATCLSLWPALPLVSNHNHGVGL